MAFPIGPILSGLGSIGSAVGSIFGANDANKQSAKLAREQIQYQKDLAQAGIQWRVADAKAAGIHPLAALGSLPTYSPVSANFQSPDFSGFSKAGQSLGRAVEAIQSSDQRKATEAYNAAMMRENLRGAQLRNDYLASQIRLRSQPGTGPARPTVSATQSGQVIQGQNPETKSPGKVQDQVLKRTVAGGPGGQFEPGSVVAGGWLYEGNNTFSPVNSRDAVERLEDDWIGNTRSAIRRYGRIFLGTHEPPFKAPKGYHWVYNRLSGSMTLKKGIAGHQVNPSNFRTDFSARRKVYRSSDAAVRGRDYDWRFRR